MLKGQKQHRDRLKKLAGPQVRAMANAVVYEGADRIRAAAHRLVSQGSVSGKGHVPSAPGQPPHRDTGNLQAHMEATNPKPLVGRFTSSADYAAFLEFGTSKMAERPHIRPARDAVLPIIEREMVQKLDKLVKGSGS